MSHLSSSSSKEPWKILGDFHVEELKTICSLRQDECSDLSQTVTDPDPFFSLHPVPKAYVVLTGHKADPNPVSIPLIDVTEAIPKDRVAESLAFCSGLAFSFAFSENFNSEIRQLKPKLCITKSVDPAFIDLGENLDGSQLPDPTIIYDLLHSPPMLALVSSVTQICYSQLIDHVMEHVGRKYGEEEKLEYLKMAAFAISTGVFGKLDSVEIWLMLNLKDRVMDALRGMPLAKMPISLETPSAHATHPTPDGLGWKADPSIVDGS